MLLTAVTELLTVVILEAFVAAVLLTVLRPVLTVVTFVLTALSKLLIVVILVAFVSAVLLTVVNALLRPVVYIF